MGAAASAATISKEQCRELCPPDRWAEIDAKWASLADADGAVPAQTAFVTASKLNLGVPGTTVDMSNVGVRALMRFTMDAEQYGNLAEIFREKNDGLVEDRRERLRAAAARALADFTRLSDAEKEKVMHQGDMDLYAPEAQKQREALFVEHEGVGRELERWWQAAFLYLDTDWNEHLDWDEYQVFHGRLLRLVDDELTPDEAAAAMRADFAVDAGEDRLVSHEEFRYSVFQLADTWTISLDADEYVEFLRKSFDVVFRDLIEGDGLRPPPCWKPILKKSCLVKTALNEAKTANAISEIIVAKLRADAAADAKEKPRARFPVFCLKFFEQTYGVGTKTLLKHFRMFVNGVYALVDSPRETYHDYALTFGQMAGVHTKSSRVAAFPDSASGFMLDYFRALQPIVKVHSGGEKFDRKSALESAITKGDTAAFFGYVEASGARRLLLAQLSDVLEISAESSIYCAALLAFESLCVPFEVAHHELTYTVAVATSMQLVSLAGVISASVAEERSRAKAADPLEIGRALGSVVSDASHGGAQRRMSERHHEAKAFGDKDDARKAPLDSGHGRRASGHGSGHSSPSAAPRRLSAGAGTLPIAASPPPPRARGSQRRGSLTKRVDSGIVKPRRSSTKTRASITSEMGALAIDEHHDENDAKEDGHRAPTPT